MQRRSSEVTDDVAIREGRASELIREHLVADAAVVQRDFLNGALDRVRHFEARVEDVFQFIGGEFRGADAVRVLDIVVWIFYQLVRVVLALPQDLCFQGDADSGPASILLPFKHAMAHRASPYNFSTALLSKSRM